MAVSVIALVFGASSISCLRCCLVDSAILSALNSPVTVSIPLS